jgi:hypothetical protein
MKKVADRLALPLIFIFVLFTAMQARATTYYYTGNLFTQSVGNGDPSLIGDSIQITVDTLYHLTNGYYTLDNNSYSAISMTDGITTFTWAPNAPSPISAANLIVSDGLVTEWGFYGSEVNGSSFKWLYSGVYDMDWAGYGNNGVRQDKMTNPYPPPPGTWIIGREPKIFGLFVGVWDWGDLINQDALRGDIMAVELESTFRSTFQHFNIYGGSKALTGTVTEDGGLTADDIRNYINEMMAMGAMQPGDMFWLYIAAHGGSTDTGNETTLNPGNEGVRLGWKSQAFGQGNGTLTDDDLYQMLNAADSAGNYGKLIFMDSCHSGGFWGGDLDKLKNIALVAAAWEECLPNGTECKTQFDSTGRPIFGKTLNDALQLEAGHMKADADKNGILEVDEILPYYITYNQTRTGIVYEMAFGDPIEFLPDLLHPQSFKSDDFGGNIDYTINAQGTIGTLMKITGTGFGTKKGKVTVGGKPCKVSEWTGESITCVFKTALPLSSYDVVVKPKEPKGAAPVLYEKVFSMVAPDIASVLPATGSADAIIEISGNYFGSKKGKIYLGTKSCKVLSWRMDGVTGDSHIQFAVPRKMASGPYTVKVTNKVGSDTLDNGFTITIP